IDWGSIPGDLADRIVPMDLARIDEHDRLGEREAAETWQAEHPMILHALLDLAATVLGLLPTVDLADPPRMADFARVVAAVDHALGTNGMARYREHANRLASASLGGNPFVAAVIDRQRPFYGP